MNLSSPSTLSSVPFSIGAYLHSFAPSPELGAPMAPVVLPNDTIISRSLLAVTDGQTARGGVLSPYVKKLNTYVREMQKAGMGTQLPEGWELVDEQAQYGCISFYHPASARVLQVSSSPQEANVIISGYVTPWGAVRHETFSDVCGIHDTQYQCQFDSYESLRLFFGLSGDFNASEMAYAVADSLRASGMLLGEPNASKLAPVGIALKYSNDLRAPVEWGLRAYPQVRIVSKAFDDGSPRVSIELKSWAPFRLLQNDLMCLWTPLRTQLLSDYFWHRLSVLPPGGTVWLQADGAAEPVPYRLDERTDKDVRLLPSQAMVNGLQRIMEKGEFRYAGVMRFKNGQIAIPQRLLNFMGSDLAKTPTMLRIVGVEES